VFVSTGRTGGRSWWRRAVTIATGAVVIGGLAGSASGADAAPRPTVAQVQARINQLTSQYDKVAEQLDQASQQLSAAQTRLAQVRLHFQHANTRFQAARAAVAQTAAAAFEDTGATSMAGILTSGNPSAILQQGGLLLEQSGKRNAQTRQLLADASQLAGAEQELQRTESGIAQLRGQLAAHKRSLGKLIDTEKATLAGLTIPQQQMVQNNTIGANGSTTPKYSGPTSTQAQKAVAFAYAQLGCPYVWAGTGPCPRGFDCSGLMQAAWASAGVQIPRDSYGQWAGLAHVSLSALEPGDILVYDGESHVAMYVGNGYLIDAPHQGMPVERIPMSTQWYASTIDGAVRA
jgi:peptidoglycan DL-endopeptidase CwlO